MPAAQLAPQRAFSVASHWRRPRPAWSSDGVLACQSATKSAIGLLALFGERAFTAPDFFEGIGGGLAFLAAARRACRHAAQAPAASEPVSEGRAKA